MNNDKSLVSIIIPTLNREKVLCDTIDSVLADPYEPKELIIVDQTDQHNKETLDYLNNHAKHVRFFQIKDWKNLPAARNYGLDKSKGEIIVYLDDDVILEKYFIQAYVKAVEENPHVGVFGGSSILPNDPPPVLGGHVTRSGKMIVLREGDTLPLSTPLGANMAFRKEALEKVGGFDAQFYGNALREESDTAIRVQNAGYPILSLPEARLTHLAIPSGGTRTGRKSAEWYYNLFHNETLFFRRHRPLGWLPFFIWRMTRPFLASWLYYGRGKLSYFIAPIKGFRDGYRDHEKIRKYPKPQ